MVKPTGRERNHLTRSPLQAKEPSLYHQYLESIDQVLQVQRSETWQGAAGSFFKRV